MLRYQLGPGQQSNPEGVGGGGHPVCGYRTSVFCEHFIMVGLDIFHRNPLTPTVSTAHFGVP